MPKDIGHQVGDVVGQGIAAPAQERQRARALDEMDGAAGADAEG